MDSDNFTCSVPGCGGPRSGVCINGLNFEECPDVIPFEDAAQPATTDTLEDTDSTDRGMVPTGIESSLDATACDTLLRERGGIVVGVVAGPDVGKTTMISTMYELIHRGRMPAFQFAGSETLRGYEERCHLARLASNSMRPDTSRTPTSAMLSFTHLRLATLSETKDIIFSDRSGEHYDNALANPSSIAGFAELNRANIILLLIDLDLFQKKPHVPKFKVVRLFMAMDQNALLDNKTLILVGTKADLTNDGDAQDNAHSALSNMAHDLSRRALSNVTVNQLLIASRPRPGSTKIGEGFEELLVTILTEHKSSEFCAGTSWPEKLTELDALMRPYRSNLQ